MYDHNCILQDRAMDSNLHSDTIEERARLRARAVASEGFYSKGVRAFARKRAALTYVCQLS